MNFGINRNGLAVFAVSLFAFAVSSVHAGDEGLVISTKFEAADDPVGRQALDGTNVGLVTNKSGGKWVVGAGWNWGAPFVPAVWDTPPVDVASLSEEKTALGISLTGTGSYAKPKQIHIAADLAVSGNNEGGDSGNEGGGLGFWSAMPARDDESTSLTHFTGLNLMLNGDLQVYEDGTAIGTPVHAATTTPGMLYNLAYDVDTTTGAIANVVFNGKAVAGLSSTAFKDPATAFAGVLSRQGAGVRVSFNNFTVSSSSAQKQAPTNPKKPEAKPGTTPIPYKP